MLSTLSRRLRGKDEGFTLIELMVVVLIIAILIAIAIPTFLGARRRSQNRAAQSNLRNALTAEKTYYTDSETWGTDAQMTAANDEPSLTFQAGAPGAGTKEVMVALSGTGTSVCLSAVSASGTTFGLKDVVSGAGAGTYYKNSAFACADDTIEGGGSKWT